MQKFILFFAFATLMFAACTKDNNTQDQLKPQSSYAGTYTGLYTNYTGVDAGATENATMIVSDNASGGLNLQLTYGTTVENLTATVTYDNKLQLSQQNVGGQKMTGSGELTDSETVLTLALNSVSTGLQGGFFKGKK